MFIVQWGKSCIEPNSVYKDIDFPVAYKKIISLHLQDIVFEDWHPLEGENFLDIYNYCWKYGSNRVYKEAAMDIPVQFNLNFTYISVGF